MSTNLMKREPAKRGFRGWVLIAGRGLLAACLASIMWLHAVIPVPHEQPGQAWSLGQGDDVLAVPAAASEAAMESGSSVLPLVIALILLALAIRAVGAALRVVLAAAARLTALLLTNVAMFALVSVMLIAHFGIPDVT
jgi:hypothetical protein